jgi:hypothetical protein
MICTYLHMMALPELLRQRQVELDEQNFQMIDLLHENRLTKLSLSTVERQLMFSKQAQQYMLAYHSIEISKDRSKSETTEKSKKDVSKNENTRVKLEMLAYLVEKIIKKFK